MSCPCNSTSELPIASNTVKSESQTTKPNCYVAPPAPTLAGRLVEGLLRATCRLATCLPIAPEWLPKLPFQGRGSMLITWFNERSGERELGLLRGYHNGAVRFDAEKQECFIGYSDRAEFLGMTDDNVAWGFPMLAEAETMVIDQANAPETAVIMRAGYSTRNADVSGHLTLTQVRQDGQLRERVLCPSKTAPKVGAGHVLAMVPQADPSRHGGQETLFHEVYIPGLDGFQFRDELLPVDDRDGYRLPVYKIDAETGRHQVVLMKVPDSIVVGGDEDDDEIEETTFNLQTATIAEAGNSSFGGSSYPGCNWSGSVSYSVVGPNQLQVNATANNSCSGGWGVQLYVSPGPGDGWEEDSNPATDSRNQGVGSERVDAQKIVTITEAGVYQLHVKSSDWGSATIILTIS